MTPQEQDIPYGYCHCGCGNLAEISRYSCFSRGWIKGQPRMYLRGHNLMLSGPQYLEEDRGYDTPCWISQLWAGKWGYRAKSYLGRQRPAHAVYWEMANGPVPRGMELHHKCHVPGCVNPSHLQPLTRAEHVKLARWPIPTHCKYGHELTPENSIPCGPDHRRRRCLICTREYQRKYREAH